MANLWQTELARAFENRPRKKRLLAGRTKDVSSDQAASHHFVIKGAQADPRISLSEEPIKQRMAAHTLLRAYCSFRFQPLSNAFKVPSVYGVGQVEEMRHRLNITLFWSRLRLWA